MSDRRPRWYLEPEMLIALAALAASLCAVAVGAYEAYLQRRYDRATVWPRVELTSTTGPDGARLDLVNSGLGPALVHSAVVTVDGQRARDWQDVLTRLLGHPVKRYSTSSVYDRAIRAGESVTMAAVPPEELSGVSPAALERLGVTVCYASVYGESWELVAGRRGGPALYREVGHCAPRQRTGF